MFTWLLVALLTVDSAQAADRCLAGDHGKLLEVTLVDSLDLVEGQTLWTDYESLNIALGYLDAPEPFTPNYAVDIYRVLYCTLDKQDSNSIVEDSEVKEAGAALVIPVRTEQHMSIMYYIGTEVARGSVISVTTDPELVYEGQTAALQFGMGAGLPVLLPNGPGFDGSELVSDWYFSSEIYALYGHALLEALEGSTTYTGARSPGELYISGFSAGAHNALALAKDLQAAGTPATAVGVVEGVYDVEEWALGVMTAGAQANGFFSLYTADLAYTAQRWGGLGSVSSVFATPYRNTIPGYYDGSEFFWTIEPHMPANPKDLFTWWFYYGAVYSSCHPYRQWLDDQRVWDYVPNNDLTVIHSTEDEEVPFELAEGYVLSLTGSPVTFHEVTGDHLSAWHSSWDLLREDALAHD